MNKDARIYTKFGDAGQTMLVGRKKVAKDHPRVWVYGTMDEATSALGMARASTQSDEICKLIIDLQGELIDVMSELATPPGVIPPVKPVSDAQVSCLESLIDKYEEERIATHQFVRPGGSMASAALDLARTIIRRAERQLVTLSRSEAVSPEMLRYFNRLSDLLYILARIDEQRTIKNVVINAFEKAREAEQSNSVNQECSEPMKLSFNLGQQLIAAGVRRSEEIGVAMVLSVVDASGRMIASGRMDNALLISLELAPSKAYTAAAVRMPTHELAQLSQPGQQLYQIEANMPNVTIVGGGFPLISNGELVGAVGVSGGSVPQDMDVAQAMVKAFEAAL